MHLLFCAHKINIFLLFRNVELRYFIHPMGVSDLCYLRLQQFSFLHILTLYVMIAHTLNMCAPYILCTFDNILGLLNLDIIASTPPLEYLHWMNRFHSFIFKLCIMNVHTLKMCTDDAGPEQSLVLF